jgi:membrane protein
MDVKAAKQLVNHLMKKPWVHFPMTVMERFGRDNGGLFAAGLAFFMLLSFAPLILTGVAVMAFFIHDPAQSAEKVRQLVQGLFPSGGAQSEINHFLSDRLNVNGQVDTLVKGRSIAGIIGFLTLVWTSMQIFINASSAMNAAFEVPEKRPWILLRAVAFGLLVVSGILVSFTLFLSTAPSAISRQGNQYVPEIPIPLWLLTVVFEVIAIVINAVLYVIIYRFLPSTRPSWKASIIGGLFASVCWEIAKKLLASHILKANHSIYGGLGDLILFVLWIYYSMIILLLGAEVAAVAQGTVKRVPDHGDREEQRHVSHVEEATSRKKTLGAEVV